MREVQSSWWIVEHSNQWIECLFDCWGSVLLTKSFLVAHATKQVNLLDPQTPKVLRWERDVYYGVDINYQSLSKCVSWVRWGMENLADTWIPILSIMSFSKTTIQVVSLRQRFDLVNESFNIPINDLNVCLSAEANAMFYCA